MRGRRPTAPMLFVGRPRRRHVLRWKGGASGIDPGGGSRVVLGARGRTRVIQLGGWSVSLHVRRVVNHVLLFGLVVIDDDGLLHLLGVSRDILILDGRLLHLGLLDHVGTGVNRSFDDGAGIYPDVGFDSSAFGVDPNR